MNTQKKLELPAFLNAKIPKLNSDTSMVTVHDEEDVSPLEYDSN